MNERLEILEMLSRGTITAHEADQLLSALSKAGPAADAPLPVPPDMRRFRRISYIPFGASGLLLLLVGWGTYALSNRIDGRTTAGFVAMVILLVLLVLVTLLTFAMTRIPWLHIRVKEFSEGANGAGMGKKFALSLPVPLSVAQWGLRIARRYVDEERAAHLETAAAVLSSVKPQLGSPGTDPIIVDVDDEDERVQVYIG